METKELENKVKCEHNWVFYREKSELSGHYQMVDYFYCSKCLEYTRRYREDALRKAHIW